MALIDDITDEIRKARARVPKESGRAENGGQKETKRKPQKTKEEIAAYVARKRAEEEKMYLKKMEAKADAGKRDAKPDKKKEEPAAGTKPERARSVKKKDARPSRHRARTFKTIDLPDGGSLVIIYMPGMA